MGWLAPALLAGLAALSIPVLLHMIHRERRETLAFPSLMFLRKIPYRSVRRQKLRHLLLLALRCLALAIIVAAFARPFLQRRLAAAPTGSDARDVVIVLDRSYSMAHGGRWARALASVRTLARDIRPTDRVTLVTFASSAAQATEPASTSQRVERAIATLAPGSEPTRVAAGLRMATQLLAASELPRREIVLVSDFHRVGWNARDEAPLPANTVVKTVDVSRGESSDVAVAHVAVARARAGDRPQATVTARLTNLGAAPRDVDATLELAGRAVQTRRVTVAGRASAQAVFAGVAVPAAPTRGLVRITRDSQPSNDSFFFVTAEESGASALIVEPAQARPNQSLYLTRALAVADDPPVRFETRSVSELRATDLRGRSLIVLNEADPGEALSDALRAQVESGSLLLVAPGERPRSAWMTPWRGRLPADVGAPSERATAAAWTSVDFSNPLFEPFRVAGASGFSAVTAARYRALTPSDSAQVIARLDDGSPLLVERSLGAGRVLVWATSLDAQWTNLPFHPLWVPFVHQLARRSSAGRDAPSWYTAPHVFDLARDPGALLDAPSGARYRSARPADTARGVVSAVDLVERGFYELRSSGTAIGAGRPIAVNVDLAESDLSHADPAETVAALTSRGNGGTTDARATFAGEDGARDLERRQSMWWYLLLAAVVLLAAETLLANRISGPRAAAAAAPDLGRA